LDPDGDTKAIKMTQEYPGERSAWWSWLGQNAPKSPARSEVP
jgi:hypothetical protein